MIRDDLNPRIIRELLDYDPNSGGLKWKPRSHKHFASARACGMWNSRYAGTNASSISVYGYRHVCVLGKTYYAHRVAWAHFYGGWPTGPLDHINHDRSDNRIANLRDATRDLNNRNSSKRRDNTSGVTGVCWDRSAGKWLVQIMFDCKNRKIGRYDSFEDAVTARKAAERHYGFHENHGLPKPKVRPKKSVQDTLLAAMLRNKGDDIL